MKTEKQMEDEIVQNLVKDRRVTGTDAMYGSSIGSIHNTNLSSILGRNVFINEKVGSLILHKGFLSGDYFAFYDDTEFLKYVDKIDQMGRKEIALWRTMDRKQRLNKRSWDGIKMFVLLTIFFYLLEFMFGIVRF